MGKKARVVSRGGTLRQRAKVALNTSEASSSPLLADFDPLRLLSELQVHQVELELQNEELVQAHQDLDAASRRYWELYNDAPIGYFTLDAKGCIEEVNACAAEMLECEPRLLIGTPLLGRVAEPSTAELSEFLLRLNKGGTPQSCEIALRSRRLGVRNAQVDGSVSDRGVRGQQLLVTLVDISRRRMAEEALRLAHSELGRRVDERTRDLTKAHARLRQSEIRLTRAQSVAKIGVWECELSPSGGVFWTDEVYRLLGLECGQPVPSLDELRELVHPDDRPLVSPAALLDYLRQPEFELQLRTLGKSQTLRQLRVCAEITKDASGRPALVIGTVQDITALIQAQQERLQVELQLWQAQKMESLGHLAGGVAHDFNNLLQGVLGNVDLALRRKDLDLELKSHLDEIRAVSTQLSRLTHQLLTYAGKAPTATKPLDLNRVVREMAKLLAVSQPKNVNVVYDLTENLPGVDGDTVQLGQVFMNLVINATEALAGKSGTIQVHSGALSWDGNNAPPGLIFDRGLKVGRRYVFLEISDSGCGMSNDTRSRVFEPFFSTKFVGRGLGLCVVLGIVRRHGGAVGLWSEPGQGSRFQVFLPARNEPIQEEPARQSQAEPLWVGHGLVLFADDERVARNTTRFMLERLGFEVALASNGAEAIEVMQQRGQAVRLALLDVNMPRMDGLDAMRIIHQRWPETPVVLATGYMAERVAFGGDLVDCPTILQKPYGYNELCNLMKAALGAETALGARVSSGGEDGAAPRASMA